MARPSHGKDSGVVISDEPVDRNTFVEYGLRFDIEENFLDDKSHGFQLASSLIRSPGALTRLWFLLAVTTLSLVSQGTEIVRQGKRRWGDPQWFRGQSYLKMGWNGVRYALSKGYELITTRHLSADPEANDAYDLIPLHEIIGQDLLTRGLLFRWPR